ncbi:MAG: ketoacyl-ACP synthase III [Nitrospirae bacterium]|nr:ketoacyl-ACP synthase III [Nitrospirota bacterium]
MIKAGVIGTGSYLPEKRETIDDFLKKGATRELIEKWGVFEHRVMAEDETVTDMEVKASKIALEQAGIGPEDIDLIISGSAIPRQIGVPNSNAIQYRIGAKRSAAFDVLMACGSAIPEIIIAAQFISLKQYRYILLTGSCHLTRIADPSDPASFVVIGDGAGALVMGPSESSGILSFDIQTKGEFFDYCGAKIKKPKKGSIERDYYQSSQERLYFYIEDVENASSGVVRYLVSSVPATVKKALSNAKLTINDIDILISHQNINPLVGNWLKMLGIPMEKAHLTYSKYGNMSAANIFVNLDEAFQMNKIKKGDIVVLAGQGAGFSVGSIVMKW